MGKSAACATRPEYSENPRCQIAGFYDVDPARAQAMAKQYGGKAFDSVESLLDADIDAVSVCSANTDHRRSAIMAMERGKHVLCEKPLAVSAQDCEDMLMASRRTGMRLLVGHNQRMTPAHREAKRLISEGAIGKILTFHTTFGHGGRRAGQGQPNPWFFHKSSAVLGVAADLGIHKIDLYNYLTGDVITQASAFLATLDKRPPAARPFRWMTTPCSSCARRAARWARPTPAGLSTARRITPPCSTAPKA